MAASLIGSDSTWNKTLFFLGGTVTVSSLVYLFIKGRGERDNQSVGMDENGTAESPQPQQDDEEKIIRKVLMLGLDASGKSSILKAMQMNSMKVTEEDELVPTPTQGFHVVCVQTGVVELNIWEIGGAEKMRNYWNNFTQESDILVYVVDSSSDADRLRLSGQELQKILDDPALKDVPLILLANKQDQEGARLPNDIITGLQLTPSSIEDRQVFEIGTQVPYHGVVEGLETFEAILTDH